MKDILRCAWWARCDWCNSDDELAEPCSDSHVNPRHQLSAAPPFGCRRRRRTASAENQMNVSIVIVASNDAWY